MRFAAIQLSAYVFLVLGKLLLWQAPALLLVVACLLFVIVVASARRRINDADLSPLMATVPVVLFAIIASLVIRTDSVSIYFLLIPSTLLTLALATISSNMPRHYVQGYHGPKTDDAQSMPITQRIEPTLLNGQGEPVSAGAGIGDTNPQPQPQQSKSDPLAPIRRWLEDNRKTAIVGGAGLSLASVLLALLPNIEWPQSTAQQAEPLAKQQTDAPVKVRGEAVAMPNDYYLMLDENQGLIIHWRSGDSDNPALWSILTAKGDDSCKAIEFNDGTAFRTNLVSVENGGDYYAELSPLDTGDTVRAIADKRSFSLCGFDFSLKGSRAAIDGSPIFYQYIQ